MDADREKQRLTKLFDALAGGYDSPALRFFPFCADRLVNYVRPRPGTRVLDVTTGSGAVAVAFAQAVGSSGRITAIDMSASMLDRAEANIRKMALGNVDLHQMDAAQLDFRRDYFHSVVCSYGLFFMPDMVAALREWARVLLPGGKLAFTSFESSAFQPMLDDYVGRVQACGVQVTESASGPQRIRSLEHCRELLAAAGLVDAQAECVQLGYHLRDENEWWEVVSGTALRALLDQLPADRQQALRREHLAFVAGLTNENGLWMDVQTRFASGIKPAHSPGTV